MIKLNKNDNIKFLKLQDKNKMDINDTISKLLKDVKKRAEYEVSDTHFYRSIDESVKNESETIFGKAFGLTVEQTPEQNGRHFIELNLLHPQMRIQTSRTLAAGNKKEILEFLQKDDIQKIIQTNLSEMSEKLKER